MTPRELEEYKTLRATIRERGTTRAWLFVVGLAFWAALATGTASLMVLPVYALLPLVVLASVFEAVFALHTGVERVGRYIQVFFEDAKSEGANWEHTAMALGLLARSRGSDPLFVVFFGLATVMNFVPVLLASPVPIEWTTIGAIHLLFIMRLGMARRAAARQRAVDLEHFRRLKRTSASAPAQS